jgi:hypothetical protein
MKAIALAIAMLAAAEPALAAIDPPARQSLDDAWWTGPLLAPTAGTLPVGHFLFEPYLYDSIAHAHVDARGAAHDVPRVDLFGSQSYFLYGLAERFTVGAIPRFGFREPEQGQSSSGPMLGDLTLQAQYQLTQFEEGGLLPTISVNVGGTLPTGAYDRLARPADGFGAGLYATTLSLYSQSYYWMPGGRVLRARFNFAYTLAARAPVSGASVYGTGEDFSGHARVGATAVADLAFEYSLTRNWVAAMDFWLEQDDNIHLSGRAGAGAVESDLGRSRVLYLAPALEYNFSPTMGVIAGARVFAWGENMTATLTPVVAFNYVH